MAIFYPLFTHTNVRSQKTDFTIFSMTKGIKSHTILKANGVSFGKFPIDLGRVDQEWVQMFTVAPAHRRVTIPTPLHGKAGATDVSDHPKSPKETNQASTNEFYFYLENGYSRR